MIDMRLGQATLGHMIGGKAHIRGDQTVAQCIRDTQTVARWHKAYYSFEFLLSAAASAARSIRLSAAREFGCIRPTAW